MWQCAVRLAGVSHHQLALLLRRRCTQVANSDEGFPDKANGSELTSSSAQNINHLNAAKSSRPGAWIRILSYQLLSAMCLQLEALNPQPQSLSHFLLGPRRIRLTPKWTWPTCMRLGHLSEHLPGLIRPSVLCRACCKKESGRLAPSWGHLIKRLIMSPTLGPACN